MLLTRLPQCACGWQRGDGCGLWTRARHAQGALHSRRAAPASDSDGPSAACVPRAFSGLTVQAGCPLAGGAPRERPRPFRESRATRGSGTGGCTGLGLGAPGVGLNGGGGH